MINKRVFLDRGAKMSETNELQRLETFVTKLLEQYNGLKKESEQLQQELESKKAVIEELNEQLTTQQLEREEIGSRVGRIISQFENWEKEMVVETESQIVKEDEQLEQEIAEAEKQVHEHELFTAVPEYTKE